MPERRLKHFGWGREGDGMTREEEDAELRRLRRRFAVERLEEIPAPRLQDVRLGAPRLAPPAALAPICSTERYDRAVHAYGKAYPDYLRALAGDFAAAPDVVAYPRDDAEVAAVLDWAASVQAAVTPFGGGSSVVGGLEPRIDGARHKAAVTIDLREMGRVLEVDRSSRAARIQA
ncbi:MAG TPA: FAD-binding protein, partial [Dongiaceae bacterium]|nr:FAD-binding protein [Dongiaceae bacterium]